ncbi:MAG: COG4315 family predicted lipoprotein [Solirubrobacteraceae bacterium]
MPKLSMLTVAVGVLALAGCGSSSSGTTSSASTPASSTPPASTTSTSATASSAPAAATAQISVKTLSGLGPVLVNAQGHTLYIFEPDKHAKVTCVAACAGLWPPLKLSSGQKPTASGAVKASLLASDPDPEGGQVVTYAGWPLYTYAVDSGAGSANGQGIDTNGGLWYVISPSGKVIVKTP